MQNESRQLRNHSRKQPELPAGETYDISRINAWYEKMKKYPALEKGFVQAAKGRAEAIVTQGEFKRYIKPGDIVYYLGAGTGHVAQKIEQVTDASVYKIDIADLRTKDTKLGKSEGEKTHWKYYQASARAMPFAEKTAKCVVASDMLHHCKDQEKIIEEIKRVTVDRGILILLEDTMPDQNAHPRRRRVIERLFGWLDDSMNRQSPGVNPHGYRSKQEWQEFMEEHGFEVVDVKSWYWGPVDFLPGPKSKEHAERSLGRPFESTRFVFRKKQI